MRAVMLMFDTLSRAYVSPYGSDAALTPNFARLAEHCCTFDRFYGGSMPCMPARRELHTGRYNFLHRSWGPLEPFDYSCFQALDASGVYAHLITDHSHYWEDGGATYTIVIAPGRDLEAKRVIGGLRAMWLRDFRCICPRCKRSRGPAPFSMRRISVVSPVRKICRRCEQ